MRSVERDAILGRRRQRLMVQSLYLPALYKAQICVDLLLEQHAVAIDIIPWQVIRDDQLDLGTVGSRCDEVEDAGVCYCHATPEAYGRLTP